MLVNLVIGSHEIIVALVVLGCSVIATYQW